MVQLPEGVTRIRWTLDEDAGGVVEVWKTEQSEDADTNVVFRSLDDVPPEVAAAILADGRDEGELTSQ